MYHALGEVSVELALLTNSERRTSLFRKAAEAYKEGMKFEGASRLAASQANAAREPTAERALKQAKNVYQRALEFRYFNSLFNLSVSLS